MQPIVFVALLFSTALSAITPAPLISDGPNPNAAKAIQQQYGQLVGHWACASNRRLPDGSWQKLPGKATWSWYYVLDGYAVQDVWQPSPQAAAGAAMGTNLRTYNADSQTWNVVWTTTTNAKLEQYRSAYRNNELHIYGERPASSSFPPHLMHITFHNIGTDHFDWKYQSSGLTDGQNWQEFSRLSCERMKADG